jgi:alkylhydroperoxidase/carboxymuconolactone decarboxylase family protein YurZ
MSTNNGGCGCGGPEQQATSVGTATAEINQGQTPQIKPGLVNRKVTLLMSAGAAMAGNCEPCLRKIVPQLKEIGATGQEIRTAIYTGQMVKDRPADIMKQVADEIAGTQLAVPSDLESCPGDTMEKDDDYKIMMLIAAASAMAANCEFCLNKVIPDLIEAGVSESDMRKAVEVGQFIKDKPAAIMKEAADVLTGSNLSDKPASDECVPATSPAVQKGGCCG